MLTQEIFSWTCENGFLQKRFVDILRFKESRKTSLANLTKQWSVVESFDDLNDAVSV